MECLHSRVAAYPRRRAKQQLVEAAITRETTAEDSPFGREKRKATGSAILLPCITMKPILVADETIEREEDGKMHSKEYYDGTTECERHHAQHLTPKFGEDR